jgi:hypothetical protein
MRQRNRLTQIDSIATFFVCADINQSTEDGAEKNIDLG